MLLTQTECEEALAAMLPEEEAIFLAHLGHLLTVVARETYEAKALGVKNPIILRELNEIHHRIDAQIRDILITGERTFDPKSLVSWLTAEDRLPKLRSSCIWAFCQALEWTRSDAVTKLRARRK